MKRYKLTPLTESAKPSLRERIAASRAAAVEVLHPPATVSAPLAAMVEEWDALIEQINAEGVSDEEVAKLVKREDALQMAIYRFPAATAADLLAKVPVFSDVLYDATRDLHADFEPEDTLAGAAWLGLFRDFERLANFRKVALPVQSASLFDEIVVCWREWAAQPDGDGSEEGDARFERFASQRGNLLDAAEALPATLENVPAKALASAWLEYVDVWSNGQPREDYGTDGRLVLDIDTAITGRLKTSYLKGAA